MRAFSEAEIWAVERAKVARRQSRKRFELSPAAADKLCALAWLALAVGIAALILSRVV